jgi:hypothetical protein
MKARIQFIVSALLLSACSSQQQAVFVTSTSLSLLEGDSKPPGISIGYKRVEGYIGPNNADGSAPPVLASIESDQKVFNPKVRQLYATGNAAVIASGGSVSSRNSTKKTPELMFFGTSSNIGITIGTTGNVPDSFSFGYKRKEMSVIPLVENEQGFSYPSVLASIDTTGSGNDQSAMNAGLSSSQFFASGKAADTLAATLGPTFVERAQIAVNAVQRDEMLKISRCYANIGLNNLPVIWADASHQNLFAESAEERGSVLQYLMSEYHNAIENGTVVNYGLLTRANAIYINSTHAGNDNDQDRLRRMAEHRGFVCGLSRVQ